MRLFHSIVLLAGVVVLDTANPIAIRYTSSATARLSSADQTVIERIASESAREGRTLLPTVTQALVLEVDVSATAIEDTGETGAVFAADSIRWRVDANRPDGVGTIAQRHLRGTLLHEMHHVARGWLANVRHESFMDAVVAEGMASAFARDVTRQPLPWTDYPNDVSAWVKELMALAPSQSWPRYNEWMFNHPDGRRWIGYKAGTYLADRAMKASGKSAAELATTPTSEILRLAGF